MSRVSTCELALWPKLVMTAPVDVLTAAMFLTEVPPIEVNFPPR